MKKILFLILAISLIKGVIWAGITPFFQAPDEPLHFAHIQHFSETGKFQSMINTASLELEKSLSLLEFKKIVFRPDQKQTFTKSLIGLNEEKINSFKKKDREKVSNKLELRSENPPLYYLIGSLFYWLSFITTFITRFFLLRLYSTLCFLATIYFSYKTLVLIFSKNKNITLTVLIIISFMPMLTFMTSSINNENLFTLLVTLVIYFFVKDSCKPLSYKETLIFGLVSALAFLTKQNFISIFFFSLFIFLTNSLIYLKKIELKKIAVYILSFFILVSGWLYHQPRLTEFFLKLPVNFITGRSHFEDLENVSGRKGIYQVKSTNYYFYLQKFFKHRQPQKLFNYFWGTFGWVDTRLPRLVYYLILGFCLLSLLGFLKYLWKIKNKWRKNLWVWELLALIIFFAYSLSYYEWRFYQVFEDFFMQGRYFFPMILPIMIFLVLGWQNLFPEKWQNKALFILSLLMIVFNFYCLFFIMIPRYYDTGNLVQLVKELSQYKPIFLKGVAWPILLAVYFFLTGILIKKFITSFALNK